MTRVHAGVSILLSLMLLVISFSAAFAAGPDGLITAYPLTGSPYHVAAEGVGRVWVTLPARNAIGRLVVLIRDIRFSGFPLPTANSQPYDIVSAAGSIWVSEYPVTRSPALIRSQGHGQSMRSLRRPANPPG